MYSLFINKRTCFRRNRILNTIAIPSCLDLVRLLFDADYENNIIFTHNNEMQLNCTEFAINQVGDSRPELGASQRR